MSQPEFYPDALVWDLDGTLVDSVQDLATALNTLLNEQGHWSQTVPAVRPMIGAGVGKLIERGFRAAGAPLDEKERDSLVPRFLEIYSTCCTQTTVLVENAYEVLHHFYLAGVRQGLCTNKPRALTLQILHALDIAAYFDSVVGGDSTGQKKPHPLPLLTCLEELEVRPSRAIMIGDSGADVGAARAAGIPVVLVPDGYTGVPAEILGADFVLNDLSGLSGIMGRFQHRPFPPPCQAEL